MATEKWWRPQVPRGLPGLGAAPSSVVAVSAGEEQDRRRDEQCGSAEPSRENAIALHRREQAHGRRAQGEPASPISVLEISISPA